MIWKRMAVIGITALGLALGASGGARADLVQNGGFETNGGNGQVGYNTTAANWTVLGGGGGSYTFLFASGTADTTGAIGADGGIALWGPGNGSANGLPASSPNGGYYIAQDGAYQPSAISQTISGLTAGNVYQVGFYWAAAQQQGFTGATSDQWQVSLGSQTETTSLLSIPSEGFSGWTYATLNFTATGSSEVLSFLALSNAASTLPPFALLDGVSLNAVPEPSSALIVGLSLVAFGAFGAVKTRRRAAAAAV